MWTWDVSQLAVRIVEVQLEWLRLAEAGSIAIMLLMAGGMTLAAGRLVRATRRALGTPGRR